MSHRSFPKPVPRLVDRIASKRLADQAWTACKRLVDKRDRYRCRSCKRRVIKTLTLCPERAEHHHLVSRRLLPKALIACPHLVVLLCAQCHQQTPRLATYTTIYIGGVVYPNADKPLTFQPRGSCSQPSFESAVTPDPKDDAMTD